MTKNFSSFIVRFFSAALLTTVSLSCNKEKVPQKETDLVQTAIIPKPFSMESSGQAFILNHKTDICVQRDSELTHISQYLAQKLRSSTGFETVVKTVKKQPRSGDIYLNLDPTLQELGDEGYELLVTNKIIKISARKTAGIFYGIQTLLQLLPPEIELTTIQEVQWIVPTGTITDYPEYTYRGSMLDVARHFFDVDDVKRYIDLMARYKLNALHLHLSDDQGWRIEIKSWPNLTEHGGSTEVGGGPGGYYTQEQYSDIVRYAGSQYITIIPEIDMPGHTNAALASYPELNCNNLVTSLYTGTNVGFSTLCTSKEVVYQFVDDVVREIAALTPGPWFHIGGDESHVTKREDYKSFITRVQGIVQSHDKKVIGWDDIAITTLVDDVIAQHWSSDKNAALAVDQGAILLLSPARYAYLDMKYNEASPLGLTWAGFIEVDTAYLWYPESLIPGISKDQILGIEAPLWGETITTMDDIEYLMFPRLPGYAEIGWTSSDQRSWKDYKNRLAVHGIRFDYLDIDYYRSPLIEWRAN